MIEIKDKTKCCGCSACMNVCPQKAISMTEDFEGFLYPKVDKSKCINCGLCEKKCPIINKRIPEKEIEKSYIIRNKNNNELIESTSGGFFSPLARYILDNGGSVFGVGYDENFTIIHKEANTNEMISEFRGSKYIQSNMHKTYTRIKSLLVSGKKVLFSGTPCQVAGLVSFLGKKYDNLITVDIVCYGTPSQLLWKKYKDYQETKYDSKIKKVFFRNKTYGYHASTMKIEFENGKIYLGSGRVDYMLKSFFSNVSLRPSCYNCPFKGLNRLSDFTIFDAKNASKLNPKIKDDDKGYTNLIIHTPKGYNYFKKIDKAFEIFDADVGDMVHYDGKMIYNTATKNEKRKKFYKLLNKIGIEETVKELIPISKKDKLIEKSKIIIYKLGLIKLARKVKTSLNKRKNNE